MFKSIKDKQIVLTYFGVYTDGLTTSLIGIASQAKSNKDSKRIVKKMPMLIAECFQNVVRHGEHKNTLIEKTKECFQVTFEEGCIIISSVNVIDNKNVAKLEMQLEKVNEYNKDELKELRKEILTDGTFSDKGGAGLGLIEMTYRSGNKLKSKFVRINDSYSQFFMAFTIGENAEKEFTIESFQNEYNEFVAKDVLLLYKGDLAWETSSFIVELLHENFASENQISDSGIKEITLMIEVIQNAAKHALEINGSKEGIFAIFSKNNARELYCGNYISSANAAIVKKRLERIKNSSSSELQEQYKNELLNNKLDESGNASLGLLEIARLSENKVNYEIYEDIDEQLYYSLETRLN